MKEKNEMRLISQTERKEPHLTSGGPPLTNEQAQELKERREKRRKDNQEAQI